MAAMVNIDLIVGHRAGSGRNQLADGDILLESEQRIDLALDGGFGQHSGCLLEGSGRHEGLGNQRGLGDAQQNRHTGGKAGFTSLLGSLLSDFLVDADELALFNMDARNQGRFATVIDPYLAHHLTDNHFNVLVVDINALGAVNALNFLDEVVLNGQLAADRKDLVRFGRAFGSRRGRLLRSSGSIHRQPASQSVPLLRW